MGRLDQEHATVYFQIVYEALREPMQRALEALVMERQTEGKATFPAFAQQIFERGIREGKLDGLCEGKLEALHRLFARAGIALTDDDRARIQSCADASTLDRWVDNVLVRKLRPPSSPNAALIRRRTLWAFLRRDISRQAVGGQPSCTMP